MDTEKMNVSKEEELEILSKVIDGDLTPLTKEQRVKYYIMMCEKLGLNPHSRPFEYLSQTIHDKRGQRDIIVLYAKRDCTDQLRHNRGISVEILRENFDKESQTLTIYARAKDKEGRFEDSCGAVCLNTKSGSLTGNSRANAIMTAETKAKRRATLSFCGLGWIDETEATTIQNAKTLTEKEIEEKSEDEQKKVSEEEKLKLSQVLDLCDKKYKETVFARLEKDFNISTLEDLNNRTLFDRIMKSATEKALNNAIEKETLSFQKEEQENTQI